MDANKKQLCQYFLKLKCFHDQHNSKTWQYLDLGAENIIPVLLLCGKTGGKYDWKW